MTKFLLIYVLCGSVSLMLPEKVGVVLVDRGGWRGGGRRDRSREEREGLKAMVAEAIFAMFIVRKGNISRF